MAGIIGLSGHQKPLCSNLFKGDRHYLCLSQIEVTKYGVRRRISTESCATLLGWNTIHARQTDRFEVPLPAELDGIAGFRALSVTVAWLTPVTHEHRMYRLARFNAGHASDQKFSIGVSNSKISLEIGAGVAVPEYERIRERLRDAVHGVKPAAEEVCGKSVLRAHADDFVAHVVHRAGSNVFKG